MQNSCLDFLSFADVPIILAEITAGAARNVHLFLILVVAYGAFPFKVVVYLYLAVKAAARAVVALSVELGILNVVIDKFNYLGQRREVIGDVRDLYIAYRAAA